MKSAMRLIYVLVALVSNTIAASDKSSNDSGQVSPSRFDISLLTNKQHFIKVHGNKLTSKNGQPFLFKGLNIADPDKLINENKWSKSLFHEIKSWGANVIRLPIHPTSWRERGKSDYLKIIDQAVIWANSLDLYLVVDWHSIGYLPTEVFQRDIYETTEKETVIFWKEISARYVNVPTIAIYELFNEPTVLGGKAGKADWAEWKAFNEKIIDIIYANDTRTIPLVAGFNWAYDLRPIKTAPISREGVAYTAHPYPQKAKPHTQSKENFFELWEEVWGFAAKKYPVIATEIGWVKADGKGAHIPVIDDGIYGPRIIEFMEKRGISWVAWVFDPDWSPTMISDWNYTPTQQGAFFKKEMQKTRNKATEVK